MDFSSFLDDFIKEQSLTNGKLAEKLEVPAATISHLLSGRNKPSLDFVQRMIRNYPTLDLYKLMGLEKYNISNNSKEVESGGLSNGSSSIFNNIETKNKEVKKIVILFNDNTFEEYNK